MNRISLFPRKSSDSALGGEVIEEFVRQFTPLVFPRSPRWWLQVPEPVLELHVPSLHAVTQEPPLKLTHPPLVTEGASMAGSTTVEPAPVAVRSEVGDELTAGFSNAPPPGLLQASEPVLKLHWPSAQSVTQGPPGELTQPLEAVESELTSAAGVLGPDGTAFPLTEGAGATPTGAPKGQVTTLVPGTEADAGSTG